MRSDNFELDLVDETVSVFLFRLILLGSKAVENMSQEEEENSNMELSFHLNGVLGVLTLQELPCVS